MREDFALADRLDSAAYELQEVGRSDDAAACHEAIGWILGSRLEEWQARRNRSTTQPRRQVEVTPRGR